jgi:hypothetical protein
MSSASLLSFFFGKVAEIYVDHRSIAAFQGAHRVEVRLESRIDSPNLQGWYGLGLWRALSNVR